MGELRAFIRKEFFHIFRDKRTMLVLFGIPVVLIALFGFALSVEINNINIGILASDRDPMFVKLVSKIQHNSYFNVVGWLDSPDEIDPLMRKNKVDVVLAFTGKINPDDPGAANISIITDASNPNAATSEAMYVQKIISDFISEANPTAPQQIVSVNTRMLYNPQLKSSYNFVPGIMGLILILIGALMTSVSIVREKERGTKEVILVSPVRPMTIMVAKLIPYFVICAIDLSIILILSFTILGVPMAGSLFWIMVISLIYILLALSIGLLVSELADTQLIAMIVCAVLFMLPILMFSGMLFPIESMPKILQPVSLIIPARWYISAMRKIMIEGLPIIYVLKEMLILIGMTAIILTAAFKKYNYRLQ